MISVRALLLLTVLTTLPVHANQPVSVQINSEFTLKFSEQPRLLDVLQQSGFNASTYWPEAALYRVDNVNSIQPKLQRVLTLLQSLAKEDPEHVNLLYRYLSSGSYEKRITIPLDIDLSRVHIRNNPMVDPGEYKLVIGPRSGVVTVLGAVRKPGTQTVNAKMTVAEYSRQAEITRLADKSFVWIIDAGGNVTRNGTAYWNTDTAFPGVGSIIYVPFASSFSDNELDWLNQSIIELLINRVNL